MGPWCLGNRGFGDLNLGLRELELWDWVISGYGGGFGRLRKVGLDMFWGLGIWEDW